MFLRFRAPTFFREPKRSPINRAGLTREDCAGFAANAYARLRDSLRRQPECLRCDGGCYGTEWYLRKGT